MSSKEDVNVLSHSLFELILNPYRRTAILHELKNCLKIIDEHIVKKSNAYLDNDPDVHSMVYQTARNYLRNNYTRRPLYVAIQSISSLIANPNFFREFYVLLTIFVQFKDVVKKDVAPHTTEPVFRQYFGRPDFYSRFKTFMPEGEKLQTVNAFIQTELSLLLIALNIGKQ